MPPPNRSAGTGAIRSGDWLIGWGCAATMYPTQMGPATARVTITPQGAVKVQTAAHDIGTGAYTVVALTAADRLGVTLDKISVELGDSDLPFGPVAGGSQTTATAGSAIVDAAENLKKKFADIGADPNQAETFSDALRRSAMQSVGADGKFKREENSKMGE